MAQDLIIEIQILLRTFSATIRDFEEDIRILRKTLINAQLLKE
jgi:hypothetical protein